MPDATATAEPATTEAPAGWDGMDTLGLIAAVFLVAVVIDIVTDGRLISRRLRGQRPAPEPEVPGE